ncbi:uncharacterized protein LOC144056593 [Vanacampus margaritifer]
MKNNALDTDKRNYQRRGGMPHLKTNALADPKMWNEQEINPRNERRHAKCPHYRSFLSQKVDLLDRATNEQQNSGADTLSENCRSQAASTPSAEALQPTASQYRWGSCNLASKWNSWNGFVGTAGGPWDHFPPIDA